MITELQFIIRMFRIQRSALLDFDTIDATEEHFGMMLFTPLYHLKCMIQHGYIGLTTDQLHMDFHYQGDCIEN